MSLYTVYIQNVHEEQLVINTSSRLCMRCSALLERSREKDREGGGVMVSFLQSAVTRYCVEGYRMFFTRVRLAGTHN